MNGETKTFKLQGMYDGSNPEPGWAERIVNLTCDQDGNWKNCTDWWWLYYNAATPPTHYLTTQAFQSMFWWGQRGTARQWLVWERGVSDTVCNLEVFDGVNASLLTLATNRTRVRVPDPGTTYIPIGGWLYIVNGYDAPVRWNGRVPEYGSELVQIGFDDIPTPPTCSVGADGYTADDAQNESEQQALQQYSYAADRTKAGLGDQDAEWRYGYAITYVNEVGAESPPSPTAFVSAQNQTTAGTPAYYCARVQWGTPPSHVKAIRLYRTVDLVSAPSISEGVRFGLYHRADLPPAAGVFLDGMPDTMLGHQLDLPNTGLWPVGVRYAAYFKGTLFLAGAPTYPDRVFYSAPGQVEQFPDANTFDLGGATAGEVMGLHASQNALCVFTRRGVHLIKGNPVDGFFLETVSSEVGCVSPGAVIDVPGEQPGVLFFDVDGPYMLVPGEQGPSSLRFAGDGIRQFWRDEVNHGALLGMRAARYRRDQEVLFVVPTNGMPESGQMGLVYHYLHGYWSLRNFESTYLRESLLGARIDALCEIGDHRGLVAVGSDDVYVSGVRNVIADNTNEGAVWLYRFGWMGPRTSRATVAHLSVMGHLAAVPVGVGGLAKASARDAVAIRWREDRRVMEEIDFTAGWNPAADVPVSFNVTYPQPRKPNMVAAEYEPDTWEYSTWDDGYWQRDVPRIYAFDALAKGYEVQFEIAGGYLDLGPVTLTAAAVTYTGSPGQNPWSQQRGSDRA